MGFVVFIFSIAVLVLAIWIALLVTGEFADIAQRKGYDRRRYWHFSFWLGFVGDMIILGLPDLKARELQQKQLEQLQELNKNLTTGMAVQPNAVQTASDISFDLPQL